MEQLFPMQVEGASEMVSVQCDGGASLQRGRVVGLRIAPDRANLLGADGQALARRRF